MNNKKRIIINILGILFIGIGVGLQNISGLGTNSIDSFNEVFARKIGISFSLLTFFAQILMVLIALILHHKNIGIGTIMAMLLTQYPIALVYHLIKPSNSLPINIIMSLSGVIIMCFGASLMIFSDIGMGTLEAMLYSIVYRFKWKFVYVKYSIDALFLILTYIYKGHIGIGTIISYSFTGLLIEMFNKLLKKTNDADI